MDRNLQETLETVHQEVATLPATLTAMRFVSVALATALLLPHPAVAQNAEAPAAAQDAEAPKKSGLLKKFIVMLARDVKALPSRDNATVLINGGMLAIAAYPVDEMATLRASSSP